VNNLHIISLYKLHNKLNCESRLSRSSCRARRVECVEPCCSTSSTQPKCMGSTRRMCRVDTWWAKWNSGFTPVISVYNTTKRDILVTKSKQKRELFRFFKLKLK